MQALTHLALATGSFVGTHLLLSHPLRAPLVARLGERGFLGLYSLIAFVTLGWMVMAFRAAPAAPLLWVAPSGTWHLGGLVMLLAGVMLAGSLVRNPAMVDPTGIMKVPDRGSGSGCEEGPPGRRALARVAGQNEFSPVRGVDRWESRLARALARHHGAGRRPRPLAGRNMGASHARRSVRAAVAVDWMTQ